MRLRFPTSLRHALLFLLNAVVMLQVAMYMLQRMTIWLQPETAPASAVAIENDFAEDIQPLLAASLFGEAEAYANAKPKRSVRQTSNAT